MNYDLTNYPNFTKYADELGLVGFERKVASFDFVVYESEDGEMSFDTFKERLEVRRASCLDADVEMVDAGYLRMIFGRPVLLDRVQEAYNFFEKNINLVETLWADSPESAWCDIFEYDGQLYAIAGDTEITADGLFYLIKYNE